MKISTWNYAVLFLIFLSLSAANAAEGDRARDLGIKFPGNPGQNNAITDVPGVEVGHFTKIDTALQGTARTGVTSIFPLGKSAQDGVRAGIFTFNGAGELTGSHLINEFGLIFGPIALTGTSSLGIVHLSLVEWAKQHFPGDSQVIYTRLIPVVGETYDGHVNDISRQQISQADVFTALDTAADGQVSEGNVGGGTSAICYGYKCGIGTSSRIVNIPGAGNYVVGVLVQANHGRPESLLITGVNVAERLPSTRFSSEILQSENRRNGSIIIIIATNAPLGEKQLDALARRATVGLARTGGIGEIGSGDIFIAFTTANIMNLIQPTVETIQVLTDATPLFDGVAQATEEAIINALVAGRDISSAAGAKMPAISHQALEKIFRPEK